MSISTYDLLLLIYWILNSNVPERILFFFQNIRNMKHNKIIHLSSSKNTKNEKSIILWRCDTVISDSLSLSVSWNFTNAPKRVLRFHLIEFEGFVWIYLKLNSPIFPGSFWLFVTLRFIGAESFKYFNIVSRRQLALSCGNWSTMVEVHRVRTGPSLPIFFLMYRRTWEISRKFTPYSSASGIQHLPPIKINFSNFPTYLTMHGMKWRYIVRINPTTNTFRRYT